MNVRRVISTSVVSSIAAAVAAVGLGFGFGFGLGVESDGSVPATFAQRLPFDATESIQRHARRYVVPSIAPSSAGTAAGTLRITNYGFAPTQVVIVRLAPSVSLPTSGAGAAICARGPDAIVAAICLGDLDANATAELDVAGMENGPLVVYSLDPSAGPECGGLAGLTSGRTTLAEWERTTWHPALGERIAVMADLRSGDDRAAVEGIATSGLDTQLRQRDPLFYSPVLARWDGATRVSVLNAAAECAPLRAVFAAAGAGEPCEAPSILLAELPGHAGGRLDGEGSIEHGLALTGRGEIVAAADRVDDGGWSSSVAQVLTGGGTSGQIAFPLAVGPLPDARTTLWISNQHPTATAQIDLLMWDGNGSLRVPFSDPVPLCGGATRSYDITAIAGEIPPTAGRGDMAGPPLLSLRVESTGYGIETAPPIAGVLEIESGSGTAAYSGLTFPSAVGIAARLTEGSDRPIARGASRGISVVPGVMVNHGPERRTTVLAIQVLNSNPMAERQARVDLYDLAGTLVAGDIGVQLGVGPAGFLDLGSVAGRLGDGARAGFVGTAVIRGGQNQGTLGTVALTRPVAATDRGGAVADGDALTLAAGNIVLFELAPSGASPTPPPSRPTLTPPPTRAVPTTPRPDEPTPTGLPGPMSPPLALPWVSAGG